MVIKADSSLLRALIECDSLGQAHLKELITYRGGERLKPPKVAIRNNVLTATATIDSLAVYLALKDRYTERVLTKEQTDTITIEVNRPTWWQTLWCRLGQILTPVMLLMAICKIYKLTKFRQ